MTYFFLSAILAALAFLSFTNHHFGKAIMSTQETVNAVVTQLGKAKQELLEKIADLQLQVDDAGVAEQVDLSELVAVAQALDDIVPDPVDTVDDTVDETVDDTVDEAVEE